MNVNELYEKDNLTQKDIIQLLLHNAQHMVTRDELKEDNRELKAELKEDINNLKNDMNKLESSLKNDINKLDKKIEKIENKFDRLQWLIVTTILTVLFKDYIINLLTK